MKSTIPFAFQVPGSSAFGLQSQSRTLVYDPSTSPLAFLPGFLKCFGYITKAVMLLSLLALNTTLHASATDNSTPPEPIPTTEHPAIELEFEDKLMPSPGRILVEDKPAPSKPKTRRATLNDPRGFSSTPSFDTEASKRQGQADASEPEERERIRPELNATPTKPWHRNFYIRADMGQDTPKTGKGITFKNNAMFSGGIGYRFNDAFRVDINFQIRKFKAKLPAVVHFIKQKGLFLNFYYDLMDRGYILPYLTAGAGYFENKPQGSTYTYTSETGIVSGQTIGKRSKDFTWNVGTGARIPMLTDINIDIGYKYIDFCQFKSYTTLRVDNQYSLTKNNKKHLRSHEFVGGIIFNL